MMEECPPPLKIVPSFSFSIALKNVSFFLWKTHKWNRKIMLDWFSKAATARQFPPKTNSKSIRILYIIVPPCCHSQQQYIPSSLNIPLVLSWCMKHSNIDVQFYKSSFDYQSSHQKSRFISQEKLSPFVGLNQLVCPCE